MGEKIGSSVSSVLYLSCPQGIKVVTSYVQLNVEPGIQIRSNVF